MNQVFSGAPRARFASTSAEPHNLSKSIHLRKFGNHVTVHRLTDPLTSALTTGKPMFTFTLSNYFGSPGGSWLHINVVKTAVKTRYPLTSITWPYRGLRCRPIEVEYFFEVIRWQVTGFQMIAGSSLFFKKLYEICCVCHDGPSLLRFWFQTNHGRKNSASYL